MNATLPATQTVLHRSRPIRLAMPAGTCRGQDAEWFVIDTGDGWREMRSHDYSRIYQIPGLYEALFHEHLKCESPTVIADALRDGLPHQGLDADDLRLLDVGAGNGMVGEELQARGVGHIVGIDILPEAKKAVHRDRPQVYSSYHVADMTRPSEDLLTKLTNERFNAMTCVSALGFGDIPSIVFVRASRFVKVGGLMAFNIKEDFLNILDPSGFGHLIRNSVEKGMLKVISQRRYRHRLGVDGDPIYYIAVVAEKVAEISNTSLQSN